MGKCLLFMLSLCRQKDGRTMVKQYALDLSVRGIIILAYYVLVNTSRRVDTASAPVISTLCPVDAGGLKI